MRRDYFTLEVEDDGWVEEGDDPRRPTLSIDFEGPASLLRDRITGESDAPLDDADIDVSFRLQSEVDDQEAAGVVSVTDRLTGEYVLELNTTADQIFAFIRAAREFSERAGEDDRYGIEIRIDGDTMVSYEKRTFLVYTQEGNLLREESLIPSGVEL